MGSDKQGRPKRGRYILAAYLLLLLISHGVRSLQPDHGPRLPGQQTIEMPALSEAGRVKPKHPPIEFAYRDIDQTGKSFAPVLVLLHGSPMASRSMDSLIPELSQHYRLIIPDLPGFGGSTRKIPNYSTRAHAHYTLALLDELGINNAHWLGYSQGSGVLIEVMDIAPNRIQSATMLAGIGAIEVELLGSYPLNQGLYQLQLLGLWALQEAVPHFGLVDNMLLNKQYARNFADTDMRPFRELLLYYKGPMLILQGKKDMLVPMAAAREHERIVPQSKLVVIEGGHVAHFKQPDLVTQELIPYIRAVEAGEGINKAQASKERRMQAAIPFDPASLPPVEGTALLIMGTLLHFATWISEDITCIIAGILVANGTISFFWATLACYLGILTGDIGLFLMGRIGGHPLLKRAPLRWIISEKAVEDAEAWFNRQGIAIVFISRFMPGIRMPVYVAAGALKMNILKFAFYFSISSAVWTPGLVGLAWLIGDPILKYWEVFADYALLVVVASIALFVTTVHLVVPMFSHRGRRLLVGRWNRWTRWEFWPMPVLYFPVAFKIILLAIKHRSLTVFTSCNPGMPDSGFIGESKSAILRALGGDAKIPFADAGGKGRKGYRTARSPNYANGLIARWEIIPYSEDEWVRHARFHAFIAHRRISFPVVLKPDEGQRGLGVSIVHNMDEAIAYLNQMVSAVIVQEFVQGHEYGIFYYRFPNEQSGHIFGITDKRQLGVTGDGQHNLQNLILDDPRAVCMAPRFLHTHRERLGEVPAKGERVVLSEVGTHSRGALFLDGEALNSPELSGLIDALSKNYDGFYFGRFDVITPSPKALQKGHFQVIELNGVTSESTDIYDPKNNVLHAWGKLFKQWQIAFEIGAQNREKGHKPTPLFSLIKKSLSSRTRQRQILELED